MSNKNKYLSQEDLIYISQYKYLKNRQILLWVKESGGPGFIKNNLVLLGVGNPGRVRLDDSLGR